jgi:hypothetical protein
MKGPDFGPFFVLAWISSGLAAIQEKMDKA